MIETIQEIMTERALPLKESVQTFFQIIVLKNLSWKQEKFIGETALVLGHGNPRFSEDIDLTNVSDPLSLGSRLEKGAKELDVWLKDQLEGSIKLVPPKKNKVTWKLAVKLRQEGMIHLHIDSQKYPPHSHHPIVVSFKGIPPFIVASVSLEEIMADKLIALASRNYVGGRDLFDLWYHWLKNSPAINGEIFSFLEKKKKERSIDGNIFSRIENRLSSQIPARVIDEWNRYLPVTLKNTSFYKNIYSSVRAILLKIGHPL